MAGQITFAETVGLSRRQGDQAGAFASGDGPGGALAAVDRTHRSQLFQGWAAWRTQAHAD